MTEHVSTYLGVLWLVYCFSFVHGFGRENNIALVQKPCPSHNGLALNGSCVPCLSHGCEDCSSNYRECQRCGPYQGLDTYSACTYCLLDKCYDCSADYRVCKACTPGYVLENNVCKKCETTTSWDSTWCDKSCKTSNCSACFEGSFRMIGDSFSFYYHASLTNESTCALCSIYKYYNGSTCRSCPYSCSTCKGNALGKANCTRCDNNQGYAFYELMPNGTCVDRCPWECICRRDYGKVRCVGCKDGSVRWGSTCASCRWYIENCQACILVGLLKDRVKCTACSAGYVLLKNGTCHQCGQNSNCQKCRFDKAKNAYICTQCKTETTLLSNGTCAKCPEHCEKCRLDSSNNVICTSCYGSTILLPNGTCQERPSNCDSWALEENGLACEICNNGYGIAVNGSCVYCASSCSSCSFGDSGRPTCLVVRFYSLFRG